MSRTPHTLPEPGADPRRVRISVPLADVSTNAWLDTQNNTSRSIQVLIRESIERDGVIDVVNRPIEQLPRRGRPPLSHIEQRSEAEIENRSRSLGEGPQLEMQAAQPGQHGLPSETTTTSAEAALDAMPGQTDAPEPEVERVEGTPDAVDTTAPDSAPPHVAQAPEPAQSTPSGAQIDMSDIFGHRGS